MCGCNKVKRVEPHEGCSCRKKGPTIPRSSCCYQGCGCEAPEQKNPFCCDKKEKSLCFEETCEEETFDARQIRYKPNCDNEGESNLVNLNIGLGDNLEYIIDTFGKRLLDLDYIENSELEDYPELDTFEKQIKYLFEEVSNLRQRVCDQEKEIFKLKNK